MNTIHEISLRDLDVPEENILPLRWDAQPNESYDAFAWRVSNALRKLGKMFVTTLDADEDGVEIWAVRNIIGD